MSAHNRKAGIVQAFAVVLTNDLVTEVFSDMKMEQRFLDALAKASPPIVIIGSGKPRRERKQQAVYYFAAEDEKAVRAVLARLEILAVRA